MTDDVTRFLVAITLGALIGTNIMVSVKFHEITDKIDRIISILHDESQPA